MRTYQLYLIEDEFASHYFGKEQMFYQLFYEHKESFGEMKSILERQVQYITKPISILKLHKFISRRIQNHKSLSIHNGTYYIEIAKRSYAKLDISEHCLLIKSGGTYEAETLFFEILRKSENSFLAIDLENTKYGWLKPIKERKFV